MALQIEVRNFHLCKSTYNIYNPLVGKVGWLLLKLQQSGCYHSITVNNLQHTHGVMACFSLNQQFITWDVVIDCGSYNVTT